MTEPELPLEFRPTQSTGLTPQQRRCCSLLLGLFGKLITVENREKLLNLPEPALFVFNHNNAFEALMVPVYLYSLPNVKKFSFVCDWIFGRLPLTGWLLKQIDPIYVYNKPSTLPWLNSFRQQKSHPPVLGQCVARLKQGQSLGIFPEGTRNHNPLNLLKAKKGIGHLVLLSQVPVIPIGIDFPSRIEHQKIPAFGSLILRIGQPLRFDIAQPILREINAAPQFTTAGRKKMQNILAGWVTNQIMQQIALLSGKSYPYPLPAVPPEFLPWLNPIFTNQTSEGGDNDGLYGNSNFKNSEPGKTGPSAKDN